MPRKKRTDNPAANRPGVRVNSQKLKWLRAAKNLTQEELARQSGVGISTISDMENGEPSLPAKVHDIALILGVRFEELAIPVHDVSSSPLASAEQHTILPALTLPGSADQYDTARIQELAQELACLLRTTRGVTIIHIADANSVRVTIEIADEDLPKLIDAFADKTLDVLQVSAISIPGGSAVQKVLEPHALRLRNIILDRSFRRWWEIFETVFRSRVASSMGDYTSYKLIRYLSRRTPPTVTTEIDDENGIIILKRSDAPDSGTRS